MHQHSEHLTSFMEMITPSFLSKAVSETVPKLTELSSLCVQLPQSTATQQQKQANKTFYHGADPTDNINQQNNVNNEEQTTTKKCSIQSLLNSSSPVQPQRSPLPPVQTQTQALPSLSEMNILQETKIQHRRDGPVYKLSVNLLSSYQKIQVNIYFFIFGDNFF